VLGKRYERGGVGITVAASGRGKTALALVEAVSMSVGRDLLTGNPINPVRVWHLNGEIPQHELDRRLGAICRH